MAKPLTQLRGRALERLNARRLHREMEFKARGEVLNEKNDLEPEKNPEIPTNQSAPTSEPASDENENDLNTETNDKEQTTNKDQDE